MLYGLIDKGKSQLRLSCSGSFIMFHFRTPDHGICPQPEFQRIDTDFTDAKPELGGFRMVPMESGDCLIAIHLPDDSHHKNNRLLTALYSKSFLRKKALPVLKDDAVQISEFFASQTQEAVTGANVTVIAVKKR